MRNNGVMKKKCAYFIKFIILTVIFLKLIMLHAANKDFCVDFILSESPENYNACYQQLKKAAEKDGDIDYPYLSWFHNPEIQFKFLRQIDSGKSHYVSLAFELLPLLDGADAEVILISLGNSITAEPEIFLVNLKEHLSFINKFELLKNLLHPSGPEYVDKPKERIVEIKRRIKAIKGVSNPLLQDVKQIVENELNRQLRLEGNE